jgi:hypothetical protein
MGLSVIMLAYPAATFDKLTSGAAGDARAIVFKAKAEAVSSEVHQFATKVET